MSTSLALLLAGGCSPLPADGLDAQLARLATARAGCTRQEDDGSVATFDDLGRLVQAQTDSSITDYTYGSEEPRWHHWIFGPWWSWTPQVQSAEITHVDDDETEWRLTYQLDWDSAGHLIQRDILRNAEVYGEGEDEYRSFALTYDDDLLHTRTWHFVSSYTNDETDYVTTWTYDDDQRPVREEEFQTIDGQTSCVVLEWEGARLSRRVALMGCDPGNVWFDNSFLYDERGRLRRMMGDGGQRGFTWTCPDD